MKYQVTYIDTRQDNEGDEERFFNTFEMEIAEDQKVKDAILAECKIRGISRIDYDSYIKL